MSACLRIRAAQALGSGVVFAAGGRGYCLGFRVMPWIVILTVSVWDSPSPDPLGRFRQ